MAEVNLDDDRLLPPEPAVRAVARELYTQVRDTPLVCPHGHVDPELLARNEPFPNPAQLFVIPDHYVHRMLHSAGIPHDDLGLVDVDGVQRETDSRRVWRTLCENWHLFRGTPSRLWLDAELAEVFGIATTLSTETADTVYDGLVMQLHPGALRNHDPMLHARYALDKGADIPSPTNYVSDLKPLLNRYGNEPGYMIVVFTLDESAYSRDLAPLAGYYPAMQLGPAWWFYDSPHGMRRYRELVTETAGFYNTAGFNDDTRAFASIPVRHDVARRIDCGYLAQLVTEHRLSLDEAHETAHDLAYTRAKEVYQL